MVQNLCCNPWSTAWRKGTLLFCVFWQFKLTVWGPRHPLMLIPHDRVSEGRLRASVCRGQAHMSTDISINGYFFPLIYPVHIFDTHSAKCLHQHDAPSTGTQKSKAWKLGEQYPRNPRRSFWAWLVRLHSGDIARSVQPFWVFQSPMSIF